MAKLVAIIYWIIAIGDKRPYTLIGYTEAEQNRQPAGQIAPAASLKKGARLSSWASGQPVLPDLREKYRRRKTKMRKICVAVAVLTMALLTLCCGVQAEETEELQADNVTAEEKPVRYMFVQNAQSGTLVPVAGKDNRYTLTLMGVSPQTVAFSDRPERVVVQVPMQKFLDGMCFPSQNGPNAALEILEANEEEDLAVVELFDPVYDAANKTLKYNVSIIGQPDLSYATLNERADKALPETFGPAALFIDDCPDSTLDCCKKDSLIGCSDCIGNIPVHCCYRYGLCKLCSSDDYYRKKCIEQFGKGYSKCIDGHCYL
jgi:hypothetical protein